MRVLIVISPANDRRANRFAGVVNGTIPNAKTIIVNRGVGLVDKTISEMVQRTGPHDLILQHCGQANGEYLDFLNAYRSLSIGMGWKQAPIVLFSGSPLYVEQAERELAGDSFVCAIRQGDLETNLGSFLEARYEQVARRDSSGEEIPWNILRGYRSMEYQLQVLCALLPFGVIWEANGKTHDAEGLSISSQTLRPEDFSGLESVVAERLKELIASDRSHYFPWNSESDKRIELVNILLTEKIAGSRIARRFSGMQEALCGRRLTTPLDSALQILANSRTLVQWNWRLSFLRNLLLE